MLLYLPQDEEPKNESVIKKKSHCSRLTSVEVRILY